jgi:hypothetical protein
MKKPTQTDIIVKLLNSEPSRWYKSYELLKANTPWGFLGSQGDRRARELAESGQIEVRHIGKYAEYRAKEPTWKPEKRPINLVEAIKGSQLALGI